MDLEKILTGLGFDLHLSWRADKDRLEKERKRWTVAWCAFFGLTVAITVAVLFTVLGLFLFANAMRTPVWSITTLLTILLLLTAASIIITRYADGRVAGIRGKLDEISNLPKKRDFVAVALITFASLPQRCVLLMRLGRDIFEEKVTTFTEVREILANALMIHDIHSPHPLLITGCDVRHVPTVDAGLAVRFAVLQQLNASVGGDSRYLPPASTPWAKLGQEEKRQ